MNEGEQVDHFSVLNYQGSKKNLLDFIHKNTTSYLNNDSTILDIFAGTCSVGYSFKRNHTVYANDSELYAYIISKALLGVYSSNYNHILQQIEQDYYQNYSLFPDSFKSYQAQEQILLENANNISQLIELYNSVTTVWNSEVLLSSKIHRNFELFTTYYSNSYFGIKQAMDIDSIRFAIEKYKSSDIFYPLMTSLFFAMKECVFSKDGHMAQPLNLDSNKTKLFALRNKSIYEIFKQKFEMFFSNDFVNIAGCNKVFNLDFENLLKQEDIIKNATFIYADPPYTDMQYSRYYHLLNIVAKYNYPAPTQNAGKYTKGLYTVDRFQSKLSAKSSCLQTFNTLISFSNEYKKDLAISFAYPADTAKQKTDRYVMSIEDIKSSCCKEFGTKNIEIATLDYTHSNNRNKTPKKVIEYLIMCKGNRR